MYTPSLIFFETDSKFLNWTAIPVSFWNAINEVKRISSFKTNLLTQRVKISQSI